MVVVWARDADDGKVKAFVVEKDDDGTYPDGYTAELITGKIGKRAVWQPDITLSDVRVPRGNKLAEAPSFRDVARVLHGDPRRRRLGVARPRRRRLRDRRSTTPDTRKQFGKPIASYQLVQAKLAEHARRDHRRCSCCCFRMAQLQEQGRLTGPMARWRR